MSATKPINLMPAAGDGLVLSDRPMFTLTKFNVATGAEETTNVTVGELAALGLAGPRVVATMCGAQRAQGRPPALEGACLNQRRADQFPCDRCQGDADAGRIGIVDGCAAVWADEPEPFSMVDAARWMYDGAARAFGTNAAPELPLDESYRAIGVRGLTACAEPGCVYAEPCPMHQPGSVRVTMNGEELARVPVSAIREVIDEHTREDAQAFDGLRNLGTYTVTEEAPALTAEMLDACIAAMGGLGRRTAPVDMSPRRVVDVARDPGALRATVRLDAAVSWPDRTAIQIVREDGAIRGMCFTGWASNGATVSLLGQGIAGLRAGDTLMPGVIYVNDLSILETLGFKAPKPELRRMSAGDELTAFRFWSEGAPLPDHIRERLAEDTALLLEPIRGASGEA